MGGFFLTNDKSEDLEIKILDLFKKKGMINYHKLAFQEYNLFYFEKVFIPNTRHIYQKDSDSLIGVGTFFYNDDYGYNALEKIYADYLIYGDTLFNKVKGHFNFIFHFKGKIKIVSDKTGTYHSFRGNKGDQIYISTSFLAIASCLDLLSPKQQEILEFIYSQAFYCGDTVFKEISNLSFGHIFNINEKSSCKYFQESPTNQYDLRYCYINIKDYLSFLKDIDLNITADLSAGFDTRLICAILKSLKIPYQLNTNYNSEDESDHKIAISIAKKERKPIKVITKDLSKFNYQDLIDHNFYLNEISRDIFTSAFSPIFTSEKVKCGNLIIGGYGGELYRDKKYKGIKDLDHYISRHFFSKEIDDPNNEYTDNLKRKFLNYLGINENFQIPKIEVFDRLYFFIRMMYWGGSRITYANQYSYNYHPLLDYDLIYPLFGIPPAEKKDGKFQMKLIEMFDSKMASYQSNYGYNFIWNENKSEIIKRARLIKKVSRKFWSLVRVNKRKKIFYLEEDFILNFFGNRDFTMKRLLKVNKISSFSRFLQGRIYTLETLFQHFDGAVKPNEELNSN